MTIRHTLITLAAAAVSAVALLASCSSYEAKRAIAAADSLAVADPSAAVTLADSVLAGDGLSRADRMKLALLKAKAQGTLGIRANADTLRLLDDYYDSNGTPNDRMTAKYIQGGQSVLKGELPLALQYFHEAGERADTTSDDCDFRTLHKVHVHSAKLFLYQNTLKYASDENSLALKYALKAKDTLNVLVTIEQKANILSLQGKTDSAKVIRMKLYELYRKYGCDRYAATCLGPVIQILINEDSLAKAKSYMSIYENESGLFDKQGNIEKGREAYYKFKGYYYLKINKPDSAEYFFRKGIKGNTSLEGLGSIYYGLFNLYSKLQCLDSVAKYARLSHNTNDDAYKHRSTTHLQQMQALYNYNNFKAMAENAEKDAEEARLFGLFAVAVSLLIIIGISLGAKIYIIKKRNIRDAEKREYERNISDLEKAKREYMILTESQQAEINNLIAEKAEEIERLTKEKNEYVRERKSYLKETLANAEIVKTLERHAKKDFKSMSVSEVNQLKALFADYEPLSRWEHKLSCNDYQVCLLVKLGFGPADLAILTGLSASNISNIRKRLLMKMTGKDGSTKDFDRYIRSL